MSSTSVPENPSAGPADGPAPGTPIGDTAQRRDRLRASAMSMVLSLSVVVGIVFVFVLLVPRPNAIIRPAEDVASAADAAREELSFEPVVPAGLPDGWVPTNAEVLRGTDGIPTWVIAYRTPDGGYAGVRQAADPTPDWEDTQVVDGREDGAVTIDGQEWVVRDRPDRGTTNLVLRGPEVTTIVTTQGTRADGVTLVRALGPA